MARTQAKFHAPIGLRERKKAQTRSDLADAAKAMFDKRGFDNVTVAEIANAANVSVKTLFKYFDTKEDLLFSDENEVRDQILNSVRERGPGESALDAIRGYFQMVLDSPEHRSVVEEIEGLRRSFEGNSALQGRLTLMWERYEIALAQLLREETGTLDDDPTPRLVAAQLVSLFRLFTSEELRKYLHSHPMKMRRQVLKTWVEGSLSLVGGGIKRYAVRSSR